MTIDGLQHDGSGADPTLAGRQYDAVTALANNGYTVASTIGPDGAGWIQRYNATGQGAVDGARILIGATSLHALKTLADGSVLAAGDTPGGTNCIGSPDGGRQGRRQRHDGRLRHGWHHPRPRRQR